MGNGRKTATCWETAFGDVIALGNDSGGAMDSRTAVQLKWQWVMAERRQRNGTRQWWRHDHNEQPGPLRRWRNERRDNNKPVR